MTDHPPLPLRERPANATDTTKAKPDRVKELAALEAKAQAIRTAVIQRNPTASALGKAAGSRNVR